MSGEKWWRPNGVSLLPTLQREDIDTDIIYVNGGFSVILRPAEFKVAAETLCFFNTWN